MILLVLTQSHYVLVHKDNIVMKRYINHYGGTNSDHALCLKLKLLRWALSQHHWVHFAWQESTMLQQTCWLKCMCLGEWKPISRKSLTGHSWASSSMLLSLVELNSLLDQDTQWSTTVLIVYSMFFYLYYWFSLHCTELIYQNTMSCLCLSFHCCCHLSPWQLPPWIHLWSQMGGMVWLH